MKTILTKSIFNGIEWIVVSLGENGAFVKNNDEFYSVSIPNIDVVNPVGSGDATIAGLAKGIFENNGIKTVIKTGMTAGMLNTMESKTGHINPANFDELFNQVNVSKL